MGPTRGANSNGPTPADCHGQSLQATTRLAFPPSPHLSPRAHETAGAVPHNALDTSRHVLAPSTSLWVTRNRSRPALGVREPDPVNVPIEGDPRHRRRCSFGSGNSERIGPAPWVGPIPSDRLVDFGSTRTSRASSPPGQLRQFLHGTFFRLHRLRRSLSQSHRLDLRWYWPSVFPSGAALCPTDTWKDYFFLPVAHGRCQPSILAPSKGARARVSLGHSLRFTDADGASCDIVPP